MDARESKRFKLSQEDTDNEIDNIPVDPKPRPVKSNRSKRRSGESSSVSKRMKSLIAASSTPVEGECGIMEKLCLTNFMCHKKLEVELGQNVNLILGLNGSGKSAIMSAIYVGLGGRAMCTNRGSSIKTFIQKGQSYAQVEITLKNTGDDSYQPDRFGRSIHVIRRITPDGASSYRIQDHNKKTLATTKDELNSILEQFSIQIENPISMLNQDTSRSFLASNNPGNMYKLFMKATHLEQMCQDYDHIDQALAKLKYVIAAKSNSTAEMEHEIKNLENIYKGMGRIISLEAKLSSKYREQAWALVKEKENLLVPIEHKIKKCEKALEKCDKEIDSATISLNQHSKSFDKTKEEYEAIGNQAKDVHSECSNANSLITAAKQCRNELGLQLKAIQQNIASCKKECSFFEKKIKELKERAKKDLTPVWEERKREEDELSTNKNNVEQKLLKIEEEIKQNQSLSSKLNSRFEGFRNKLSNNDHTIVETKNRIERLLRSQSNELSLYGEYMPALMEKIRTNSSSFSRTPKGPIGSFLAVKDRKWALGVEAGIGGLMKSFIVDNLNDRVLLNRLMKEVCRDRPPPIVSTQFSGRPYDISRFKARSEFPTIFDMITCPDIDVMNYLIDTAQIESTILIEQHDRARSVMWKNAPANCSTAYTIAGDEIQRKGSAFSNREKKVKYLEEDVSTSIDAYRRELKSLQVEREKLSEVYEACKSELNRVNTGQNDLHSQSRKLNTTKRTLERQIEDLIAKTNEEQKQQEEIEPFENALQESKHKEEQHQLQIRDTAQSLKTAENEMEDKINAKKQVDERLEVLKEEMDSFKKKLIDIDNLKDDVKTHIELYREKREKFENIIRGEAANCEKFRDEAEQLASEALRNCGERIDTESNSATLESVIKQTKKAIQLQQESQIMSREECTQKLTKRIEEYKVHKDTMKVMSRLFNKLSVALAIRMKKHEELQDMMIIRASHYFQQHLSKRNYSGRIRFDPKSETLNLEVTTNRQNKRGTHNTCTLSGGERSYTTVCFIMSLWEAMESPFRCLDEFDVFMDMVNRAISIDLMMNTAAEFPDRQFIFFTPLDMTSYINSNVDVKILRLSQPERSNTS
ncbi:hypothetical protein LOD99_9900 [Oopsacas minuta]|uniref:Rad50/SbcC-type AAA domain-containing protein n=1 Tax=Oopsacas minuta TaxID=111878 RepID=A0AAV7KK70_9METZ|nr:hypothetical protein LOD99_9900 [Oopsacas minuta]